MGGHLNSPCKWVTLESEDFDKGKEKLVGAKQRCGLMGRVQG
jgi:hypothetical protein